MQCTWDETGCSFPATVIGEYAQDEKFATKMYDILYDERVGGRLTRECHVEESRLCLNLNKAGQDESMATEYILGNNDDGKVIHMKVMNLHATSGKDLISKLIALKEDEDEEEPGSMDIGMEGEDSEAKIAHENESQEVVDEGDEIAELDKKEEGDEDELTLNHQQLVQLNEALHVKQIKGLITSSKKTLRFITAQLLAMVTSSDNSEISDFEARFGDWAKGKQGYSDPTVWFSPGQEGGLLLAKCRASLSANAALIRIMSCHVPGLDLTAIDEERVEQAVRSTSSLLNSLCHVPTEDEGLEDGDSVLGSGSRLKAKSSGKSGADIQRRSVLTIIGPAVLPVVRAVLDALELLLGARRQSDKLCVASYELAYAALRTGECKMYIEIY